MIVAGVVGVADVAGAATHLQLMLSLFRYPMNQQFHSLQIHRRLYEELPLET